jgi:hypothetical protein
MVRLHVEAQGVTRAGPEAVEVLAGDASRYCGWGPWSASGYQGRGDQEASGARARLGSSPDVRAAAGRRGRGNYGFAGNSPDSRAVPGSPSVKACHMSPSRTGPWGAPSPWRDAAVHTIGCAPNLDGPKGVR